MSPVPSIPSRITLPGNFRVRVRYLTHDGMQALAKKIANAQPDEVVWSLWDQDSGNGGGVIYLTRGRHPLLVAADFRHEFDHGVVEWRDWWMDSQGLGALVERGIARESEGEA